MRKKYKNTILKALYIINAISFLAFATALDSNSIIPMVVMLINATYLLLFVLANTRG